MLARARKRRAVLGRNVPLAAMDVTRTGFPAASFDAVVASFLFCVLEDGLQRPALAELARILRPGGTLRLLDYSLSARPCAALPWPSGRPGCAGPTAPPSPAPPPPPGARRFRDRRGQVPDRRHPALPVRPPRRAVAPRTAAHATPSSGSGSSAEEFLETARGPVCPGSPLHLRAKRPSQPDDARRHREVAKLNAGFPDGSVDRPAPLPRASGRSGSRGRIGIFRARQDARHVALARQGATASAPGRKHDDGSGLQHPFPNAGFVGIRRPVVRQLERRRCAGWPLPAPQNAGPTPFFQSAPSSTEMFSASTHSATAISLGERTGIRVLVWPVQGTRRPMDCRKL